MFYFQNTYKINNKKQYRTFSFPNGKNQAKSQVPVWAKLQELFLQHYQKPYLNIFYWHILAKKCFLVDVCFIGQEVDSSFRKDCDTRTMYYHKHLKFGAINKKINNHKTCVIKYKSPSVFLSCTPCILKK